MSNFITIHPENPQSRFIRQVAEVLQDLGVIAYPTDSGYALGCKMGSTSDESLYENIIIILVIYIYIYSLKLVRSILILLLQIMICRCCWFFLVFTLRNGISCK